MKPEHAVAVAGLGFLLIAGLLLAGSVHRGRQVCKLLAERMPQKYVDLGSPLPGYFYSVRRDAYFRFIMQRKFEDLTDPHSIMTARDRSVRTLGTWSAVLCTIFSLAYVLAQLGEWLGLLGSAGGPHSRSTSLGLAVLLTPSLLLGVSFVALTTSIHYYAETPLRIWNHLTVTFASMYATLISLVYYVQLTFVIPRLTQSDAERIELLIFEPFDSFLYAVDVLGYSLMSLSTLFAAAVFKGAGTERWIRWALIANGCLIPFLALQMYYPPLIWGGSLWAITFPTATWLLAIHFSRLKVQ